MNDAPRGNLYDLPDILHVRDAAGTTRLAHDREADRWSGTRGCGGSADRGCAGRRAKLNELDAKLRRWLARRTPDGHG
jgi:hypothetical protein